MKTLSKCLIIFVFCLSWGLSSAGYCDDSVNENSISKNSQHHCHSETNEESENKGPEHSRANCSCVCCFLYTWTPITHTVSEIFSVDFLDNFPAYNLSLRKYAYRLFRPPIS